MIMYCKFKENMRTWMETVELAERGEYKMCNATN